MSLDAMRWSFSQDVGSSAERLVLLALANHCRKGTSQAWPSRQYLAQTTCLDLKTVTRATRRLLARGLIREAGRKGRTSRVVLYELLVNKTKNGPIKSDQKRNDCTEVMDPNLPANRPKNGICNGPKNGTQNQGGESVMESLKSGRRKKTRLPSTWLPSEDLRNFAFRERPDLDLDLTARKFIAYHLAQGSWMSDWDAAFRKWVLSEYAKKSKGRAADADLASVDYSEGLPS